MPRRCFIKNCRSNIDFTNYTPTFSFPGFEARFNEWVQRISEKADYIEGPEPTDTVCIKHFEERFVCQYTQAYDSNYKKKPTQRSKLTLTSEAVPTLNLHLPESGELETKVTYQTKPKRGSSGLANLQKARIRKMQRRERMQELLKKRSARKTPKLTESYDNSKDFFLGDRKSSDAENIVIGLRLHSLVKRLHDGSKLCKDEPNDISTFPTFKIIKHIEGLGKSDKNPLNWSIDETFTFVKYISSVKNIAKVFRAEDVDGEALLNLTYSDLVHHFNFDAITSESLMQVFTQLRSEVIERYLNI